MNFWTQATSTFVGAILAFIFSLTLFYLTERWRKNMNENDLLVSLKKEFEFNIEFLKAYKEDFDKMLRQIAADDKNIFTIFKFNKLQRLFISEAFQRGLLYKFLNSGEITDMDSMLNFFTYTTDNMAWNTLNGYKEGRIAKQVALSQFEWDNDQIKKYISVLENLKKKIKK
ncbi:MAG: hypothetical protein A2172_02300 [Candidatus Woykebacteria bacterium RBG_13_40_15]|uniref:DUF4760 domain-containing protein n=1 Tax=Candidatus Woykebacteria bacterium RBG_13_40_15 TaxID=1802593 RepID=A0A1G1W767_9BACT|nr:MAG: hypothetical protein A2172_02300 [Candidatus Woykebacteria bacterium RBG_13_40_15]